MIILKNSIDVAEQLKKSTLARSTIGFVPTMGALHPGHIKLIEQSKKKCDVTVCSIFVNPTQFNNIEDFKKYPVTIEQDIYLLEKNGCDLLFIPDVKEIYPEGTNPSSYFDLGYLETILEGKYRPGHFQGVCRVVKKLMEIVSPHHLFLGQKDYQQCMVIKRLLEITNSTAKLNICPTLRHEDGLAMSSRNTRLSSDEKLLATEIYKTLLFLKEKLQIGDVEQLKNEATKYLASNGFRTDYVEIAEKHSLNIISDWDGIIEPVALIAAFIGDVRLIDNLILSD